MFGNSPEAQAAKMAEPSNTLSSLSGTNTGIPVKYTPEWNLVHEQIQLIQHTQTIHTFQSSLNLAIVYIGNVFKDSSG